MKFPHFLVATPSNAGTTFALPGGGSWTATEAGNQAAAPENTTLSDLAVWIATAPGGAASWTFKLRVNGVDTAAVITITGAATSGTWSGTVTINDGDLVSLTAIPSGSPVASGQAFCQSTWNTVGQSAFLWGNALQSGTVPNSADTFSSAYGRASGGSTEDNAIACPMACTFTRMRAVTIGGSPGAAKSYAVSLRQNATDQLTATVSGTNTTALATGSVAGAVGDVLDVKISPSGTPTARRVAWGFSYTPAINGETIMGPGSAGAPPTTSAAVFNFPVGQGSAWGAEASRIFLLYPALQFKGLTFVCATAPGGVAARSMTMRDNGANTTMSVTLTGAQTSGQDTTHSWTMSGGGNSWSMQHTAAGTPAAVVTADVHVGFVLVTPQNTLYTQTINATSTATVSIARATSVARTAASTAAASCVRRAGKTATAAAAGAASIARAIAKAVAATSTAAATVTRSSSKPITATSTATPTVSRVTSVGRTAQAAGTAAISRTVAFVRSIAAQATGTASREIQTNVHRTAGSTATASISSSSIFSRVVTALASGTASVTRAISVSRTAQSTVTVTLRRATARTLSAASTAVATVSRATSLTITASSTALASVVGLLLGIPQLGRGRITDRLRSAGLIRDRKASGAGTTDTARSEGPVNEL